MNNPNETLKNCIELMRHDVAEFEAKHQGRFAETPHIGLGNRKQDALRERGDAPDHHVPPPPALRSARGLAT